MTRNAVSAQEKLRSLSNGKSKLLEFLLEKRSRQTQEITPYPRSETAGKVRLQTSWAQRRLWFIDQLESGGAAYNMPVALRLRGSLDREALQKALNALVQRHEILRTVFVTMEGEPRQEIAVDGIVSLEVLDLSGYGAAEREAQVELQKTAEADGPFDLCVGPLIRGRLLQVQAEEHVLLITMHHIVSDGWSMGILIRELAELYRAYQEGRKNPLEDLPIQYADYAQWQRQWLQGDLLEKQLSYWRALMDGAAPELELPTDRPRPAVQSYRGERVALALNAQLSAELRNLAKRHGMTLFMVLYAAWTIFLSRLSGQEDVVIGTPVANRQRAEFEGLIGFFVNTLVLRVQVGGHMSLQEFLGRIKDVTLGAYEHQDMPFEQLVEALRPQRSLSRSPIFQVMFALQNAPKSELSLPGVAANLEDRLNEPSKFDLLLALEERGEEIAGNINYATDLFNRDTVQRWIECFTVLLKGMTREEHADIDSLPILPISERWQVIEIFNATQVPYSPEKLIHELFEEQVERKPDAVAVVYGTEQLTYHQLNGRANQLAHVLSARGVRPNDRVGLYIERSVEMVIGLLGILKAGGAYVPLDVSYPAERLAHMLRDSAPVALLTHERLKAARPVNGAQLIAFDADRDEIGRESHRNLDADKLGLKSRDLAYVIYTSGSTGTPKGVAIEHRNVVNLIHWHCAAFDVTEGSRCSSVAAVGFDAAAWEIWPSLSAGATLVLVPPDVSRDAEAVLTWWASQPLDVSFLPTPMAEFIFNRNIRNPTLRTMLVGGDRLRYRPASAAFSLVNNYGPTESTVLATSGCIRDEDAVIHIGRPISNAQIYILDRHGKPAPIGVAGEIYIGGAGVARGYLNRPELTAQQFLSDPFSADPQGRMYKTGDLGRWRADGAIEYLGRNDHQVKIRGFRIELGEIEAQLVRHDQVKDAVAFVREDVAGEKRLVAYVTPRDQGGSPTVEALRGHLKAVLPEYMVPSAFVVLERLPLTSNGKLDRQALPAPDLGAYVSQQYEAPRGEVEEILAGIWQGLLGVERVGRQDNFFELGGHSLLIVQMKERLRRLGLSAEVRRVFESPTLADLASALTREAVWQYEVPPNSIPPKSAAITPQMLPLVELDAEHIERIVQCVPGGAANIQDIYPLAPLQEGILFHHLLDMEGGDAYVLPTVLSASSRDRLEELIVAFQKVVDRHDVLRTAVLWEHLPRSVQVVYRQATLPVEEITLDPARDLMEQIKEWIRPERQRLDLRRAPMLRLRIAEDKHTGQWYVLRQLHHIICDHVTAEIVTAEVIACLEHRIQNFPEPAQYRNHVAQALAYVRTHDAEAFFRRKLGEITDPTAPFGLLDVRGDGSHIEDHRQNIAPELAANIRVQARRMGVSSATLFHAAWGLVVASTSGRNDVVFGSVLLGRLQGTAGGQRTLGMFINSLPLRLRLQGVTTKELVEQTQRELVELLSHEQASLAMAQRCSGVVGTAPLFSTLLNYRHSSPNPDTKWPDGHNIRVLIGQERTNYPITLSVDDLGQGFTLKAQTDRRVDPSRMTEYLHTAMRALVKALEETPHKPALALSVLPDSERHQVLKLFNATQAPLPRETLIHELFQEQVRRTPQAVAVVHEEQSMTYVELNSKANQLARYLRKMGIDSDPLVGICVERSFDMVVGLLGILKAGGTYVPLDPNYPPERLRYMLDDASPRVVLTQEKLKAVLGSTAAEVIPLDTNSGEMAGCAPEDLSPAELEQTAPNLVYVIYTSGSTGRPKGTEMSHRSMVNLIQWHRDNFDANEGKRVLQFAALSFDVAFQETFSTLCTGGALVLLDESVRRDARALAKLLSNQSIERLFVPPLILQSLAEHFNATGVAPEDLQDIITAGEQLRISPQISNLFRHFRGCRLHNHYGPTETHVVTALTLTGDPGEWPSLPSIGRPIANTQIYILNEERQPVPIGIAGEICIGGAGVARGYRARPELTAQRFIRDRFSPEQGARLYCTGDLGLWREDGAIEYLGRNDDQIKIRGYRIELGEIEAQFAKHEDVKEVAVVARQDAPGEKRLVAYVTLRDLRCPSVEDLRAYLKTAFPEYMVPSAIVILQGLPQTPSGKLNRRALPEPELDAFALKEYEPPEGEIEEALAEIWRDLLRLERIGRQDNFFELGGHSLHGMKMIVKVEERFMVGLSVIAVFQYPTIQQMAKFVESLREANAPPLSSEEMEFEEGIM